MIFLEGTGVPPPSDYQLLLPEGWFRVLLEPQERVRSIDALVARQFAGIDDAPHVRRQLRQELLKRASEAFDDGGLELYLSLQHAGPLSIPASLLVTLGRPPEGGALPSLEALASRMAADAKAQEELSLVDIAAGQALRLRSRTDPAGSRPGASTGDGAGERGDETYALPSVTLDYQVRVPGADAYLLLAFSTPLVPIADAMVELFDAIAGSLSWKGTS